MEIVILPMHLKKVLVLTKLFLETGGFLNIIVSTEISDLSEADYV